MIQHNENTTVTVGILNKTLKEALKINREEIKKDTRKIVHETLGEFTEEVLLPAIDQIVDEKVGSAKTELKDYVDKKNAELRGNLVSVMRGDKDRDQTFKTKMTEIVARNKLAKDDEVALLYGLAH